MRFTVATAAAQSLEGSVRDAVSGLPVPGLEVRVVGADGAARFTTTDTEGRFVLSGLPEGAWTVVAEPPGHVAEVIAVEVERLGELGPHIDPADGAPAAPPPGAAR